MSGSFVEQEVQRRLASAVGTPPDSDPAVVAEAVVRTGRHAELLREALAAIVARSSRYKMLKFIDK